MTEPSRTGDLETLRELLLTSERAELDALRARVHDIDALEARLSDLIARVEAQAQLPELVDRLNTRVDEHGALAGRIEELITLLDRVVELESRSLEPPRRTTEVSEVLPNAIRHRRDTRDDLKSALQPDIERAVHDSIRRDPSVMADALYPVMGPAIRKLVLSLFSFDQLRAGAKYKLSHSYLIHRATSLPLAVHTPEADDFEADMVSGMMEALRSFVQDAFDASDVDGLQELRVGEVELWVEWGPEAVLAVVVRGDPPGQLRLEMQRLLEMFHNRYRAPLSIFDGDSRAFSPMESELLALTERLSGEPTTTDRLKSFIPLAVVLAIIAVIVVLIVVWA